MPRRKTPRKPADPHAAFWAVPWELTDADRQRIEAAAERAGCAITDAFIDALLDVGADYRGERELVRPIPRDVRGSLGVVEKQAQALRRTLQGLDYVTRAQIQGTRLCDEGPFPFLKGFDSITRELLDLEVVAARAVRLSLKRDAGPEGGRPKGGRPKGVAESFAAQRLRAVFERHGLPFTTTQNRKEKREGLAAVCLCLVLDLPLTQNVRNWLRGAHRTTR